MLVTLLFMAAIFVAYTNGANDNFKGVATLAGSKTLNYKQAITWATVTQIAGSVCSVALAAVFIKNFSGKGLVPNEIATSMSFLTAVGLGAGATVLLATLTGFPISTTHSLTGALFGAGLMSVGMGVNFAKLGKVFFFPLIASPGIALCSAAILYMIFRFVRQKMGITKEWCVCVGNKKQVIAAETISAMSATLEAPDISIDKQKNCEQRYVGRVLGIGSQKLLDGLHVLSAGAVCFARGLNDTPKIVALVVAVKIIDVQYGLAILGVAMAIGGLLNARKVAHTMSDRITGMNHGQGFTANLVSAFLVIVASRWGVPVSTTHVTCGSIFGIGLVSGRADKSVISQVVMSWVLTLPIAAVFSGAFYWILSKGI